MKCLKTASHSQNTEAESLILLLGPADIFPAPLSVAWQRLLDVDGYHAVGAGLHLAGHPRGLGLDFG